MRKLLSVVGVVFLAAVIYIVMREKNIGIGQPKNEQVERTGTEEAKNANAKSSFQSSAVEQGAKKTPLAAEASPVETVSARQKDALAGIEFAYGKAMFGLGLSESELEKLQALLLARADAVYIAQDVVLKNGAKSPRELPEAAAFGRAEVEEEIRKSFGEEKYSRISAMLESTTHLLSLKMNYEPALMNAGIADINPRQTLELASIMLYEYGSNNSNFASRIAEINTATGLTPYDDRVLAKAAAILAPTQLSVLSQVFSDRNRKISQPTSKH